VKGNDMKSEKTKENIVSQTINLIKEANGEIEDITIRKIAERTGVGVGLVNHYFKSKDALIEVCVQAIISDVIHSFRPEGYESNDPIEITKCAAKQVMDFLMDNKQISKVSILSDLKRPMAKDNTMKSVYGFGSCLSQEELTQGHLINSFILTMVLQGAFLRKDSLKESLGVDFNDKSERDSLIDYIIERFGGKDVLNY
jgi:AcrR family transcriptional regulator